MDCVCDQDGSPNCENFRNFIEQGQELATALEAYWSGASRMNGGGDEGNDMILFCSLKLFKVRPNSECL